MKFKARAAAETVAERVPGEETTKLKKM